MMALLCSLVLLILYYLFSFFVKLNANDSEFRLHLLRELIETNTFKSCIGGRSCWLWTQIDLELKPSS